MEKKKKELSLQVMQQIITANSILVDRLTFAAQLGQQYGGDRNIYQALGYDTDVTYEKYYGRYRRQDIASAVINRPVDATWRGDVLIEEPGEAKDTQLETAWIELYDRLALHSKLARLDRLSGIGQYGVLMLGLDDAKTANDFAGPVTTASAKLLYVKPLGEGSARINSWEQNAGNERYGLPLTYNITITSPGDLASSSLTVHHSRVIHVAFGLLESETEGTPELEVIYNRLMDLEKLVGGSAEMFWRGARPGYKGKIDKDYEMSDPEKAELQEQFDEYEHNLRRFLVSAGVDYEALSQQIADPISHVDVQIQMISAAKGIPKRILVGSERGELASSQDKNSWFELIDARREEKAEPIIVRPLVDRCILYGILPKPQTGDYSVKWSDLWAPSEKEKAEVGKIRADGFASYVKSLFGHDIVVPKAFFKFYQGFSEEQIESMEKMRQDVSVEEQADFEGTEE